MRKISPLELWALEINLAFKFKLINI